MLINASLMKEINESIEATVKSRYMFVLKEIIDASLKGETQIHLFVFSSTNQDKSIENADKIKKMLTDLGFEVEVKMNSKDYILPMRFEFTFSISW